MHPLYVLPATLDTADATLKHLMEELTWLAVTPARKEYFMSDAPRAYAYKTFDGMREYHSSPFTPLVAFYQRLLNLPEAGGPPFNYNVCFLNRYDNQHNQLGWHADDSPEMDHAHPIAVVSFGAAREIWWKPKTHKGPVPAEWRQELGHGSVFVMPAGFQRDHFHRIPKADRAVGPRVSLTFRHYIDRTA